jgi:hypothetical protein
LRSRPRPFPLSFFFPCFPLLFWRAVFAEIGASSVVIPRRPVPATSRELSSARLLVAVAFNLVAEEDDEEEVFESLFSQVFSSSLSTSIV